MASMNTLGGEFIVAASSSSFGVEEGAANDAAARARAAEFERRQKAEQVAMAPQGNEDFAEEDLVLQEMIREQERAAAEEAAAQAEAARDVETAAAAVADAEREEAAADAATAPAPEPEAAAPKAKPFSASSSGLNTNMRSGEGVTSHERRDSLPPSAGDRSRPERKPGSGDPSGASSASLDSSPSSLAGLQEVLARGQRVAFDVRVVLQLDERLQREAQLAQRVLVLLLTDFVLAAVRVQVVLAQQRLAVGARH